jgi:hypothetical protein
MADNAGENDNAITELAKLFEIDPQTQRLRCLGHIINLVVKALLFGKGVSKLERELRGAADEAQFEIWGRKGPIGKLHNLCVYINRNDKRRQVFRDC